jgi:hypothetical protein
MLDLIIRNLADVEDDLFSLKLDLLRKDMLALREEFDFLKKYRPDQPRVPAGVPTGGQWTRDGSNSGSTPSAVTQGVSGGNGAFRVAGGFTKEQLTMTVQEFASSFCLGKIKAVLPGQYLDLTIGEVKKLANNGNATAKTCLKVLNRDIYRK